MNLDYHVLFKRKIEVIRTTFTRSPWRMNNAFHHGACTECSEIFHSMTIFGHATNFRKLVTFSQYVAWLTNELLPRIWGFLRKFRWSLSPSKLKGPRWGEFGRFSLFHGASNMCTHFIPPNPSSQVVHNHHLVLREKNSTRIAHYMWKDIGSHSRKHHKVASSLSIYLDPFAMLSW